MVVILFRKHQRIQALCESVVALQRIILQVTNGSIYVVEDVSNTTNDNTYQFVGVDLTNAIMDK